MTAPVTLAERRAALPAVVALAVCLLLTSTLLLRSATTDPGALRKQADADFAAGRFETAALRYQHLMAVLPDDPQPAYALALTMDRMNHRSDAMQVLSLIAPASGGGYAPAHLRQAEWLIEARMLGQNDDPAILAAARQHLAQPPADDAGRERVQELLAVLNTDAASGAAAGRPSPATSSTPGAGN